MAAAPSLCDVMHALAADGKHGNRIVTLLAPDHAHDGGESLIALASTSKTLYQNEDMQRTLGKVRMFRREITSHLKDHMTNMSRSIDIINVLGLQNRPVYFRNLASAVVHGVFIHNLSVDDVKVDRDH